MTSFVAKIIDPIGLHARPASKLVTVATRFESEITITCNNKPANLKSILSIMALGAKKDTEITVGAVGKDAEDAISAIKATMVEEKLI